MVTTSCPGFDSQQLLLTCFPSLEMNACGLIITPIHEYVCMNIICYVCVYIQSYGLDIEAFKRICKACPKVFLELMEKCCCVSILHVTDTVFHIILRMLSSPE